MDRISGAKQELREIRRLEVMIEQRKRELVELRQRSDVSAVDPSRERVQTSPPAEAAYVRRIAECDTLERKIEDMIRRYARLRHDAIGRIQMLGDERYIRLLYKRYVEGKPLQQIAREMHYSQSYVRHAHGRALQAYEQAVRPPRKKQKRKEQP